MEISNNTLAWLVFITIVASMAGSIISLDKINGITGLATSNTSGNVSVTIASTTSLTFALGNLNFGSGTIDAAGGYVNCTLVLNSTFNTTTNRSLGCIGFTNSTPLVLENNGNTVLNVTLNFSAINSTFIGGSSLGSSGGPQFKFQIYQNESSSCGQLNTTLVGWTEVTAPMVNGSLSIPMICENLSYANTQDSIGIGIWVNIPQDTTGVKQAVMVAQGTS